MYRDFGSIADVGRDGIALSAMRDKPPFMNNRYAAVGQPESKRQRVSESETVTDPCDPSGLAALTAWSVSTPSPKGAASNAAKPESQVDATGLKELQHNSM